MAYLRQVSPVIISEHTRARIHPRVVAQARLRKVPIHTRTCVCVFVAQLGRVFLGYRLKPLQQRTWAER